MGENITIGYTFLARSHWGGPAKVEMKRLMLRHALTDVREVLFTVAERNLRSRRAVEKLGGAATTSSTSTGPSRACRAPGRWLAVFASPSGCGVSWKILSIENLGVIACNQDLFVIGAIDIDSFDQWGVELGKVLAKHTAAELATRNDRAGATYAGSE